MTKQLASTISRPIRPKFYGDKRQAKKVFDLMISRLAEKGVPYNTAHVPQANQFLPSNLTLGTRQHAVFLFLVCLWMRGGVESDTATDFLKDLHENRPELFNPFLFQEGGSPKTKEQIEMVKEALIAFKLGQRVEENAPGWVYNMRKLARFWKGDPRELMRDTPRFHILAKRIMSHKKGDGSFRGEDQRNGFMYFREKMTAMIVYFLMDAGLVPVFYTPVPVDFHVLRLLTANEIIRVRGLRSRQAVGIDFLSRQTLQIARNITEWYCRTYHVSPIALCDALWLLSRNLCRHNPGNSGYVADTKWKAATKAKRHAFGDNLGFDFATNSLIKETSGSSPNDVDLKGRKRYQGLKYNEKQLMTKSKIRQFNKSCGVCALRGTCVYNISAGAYYAGGKMLPERIRVEPPDHHIDFDEHPSFGNSQHVRVDPTIRFTKIYLCQ
jgi:hypothetical protein